MKARLYGLFEKQADGSWKRIFPDLAYHKKEAVRIFQNALLAPYFSAGIGIRELRPVKK